VVGERAREPFPLLASFVESLLERSGLPGLALAVTDRDGLVATGDFGYADLSARSPVVPTTLFEIGSIGKCFTSVALLQLGEEGLLDLQAPVTRYLPWFEIRSQFEPITLYHLLTHTAAIVMGPDLSSDSRFDVWALRTTETGAPPGRHFHYSNIGYRVLGHVLEEVAGQEYARVVHRRILAPLGMAATHPAITSETRRHLAVGYERWYDDRPPRRDDPWVPATWLETCTADGSLASSAVDLAAFLRLLLNQGKGLLSAESFELMAHGAIEAEEEGWWYGYGLGTRSEDGRKLIRHGGSMVGYCSTMLGDLDAGLGATVLSNGPDEGDVTEQVAAVALDLYRAAKAPPSLPDPLTAENGGDYEGEYVSGDRRLVIVLEGKRLVLAHGEAPVALEPRGRDSFLVDHPDFALFLLSFGRENGAVVEARHGPDVYAREGVERSSADDPPAGWTAYPGHYRAYNPWLTNFRVVLRGGGLVLVYPWGTEHRLTPLAEGTFRVGEDDWSPERLRFDAIVDEEALRANLSGCDYYRGCTP
jgi:D-alanyl-D-alanine carboxypeptidase